MNRDAARLAERHQAGHDGVRIAVLLDDGLAVIIGGDAAHVVVHGRQHRDRLAGHVDAGKYPRAFGNARQPLVQHDGIEVIEVQEEVVLVLSDAAAFADLDRHRP